MIGPSIKIKGEVSGDEDLLIQGQVEGTISLKAHQVVVGESGQVSADIVAKTIKIVDDAGTPWYIMVSAAN